MVRRFFPAICRELKRAVEAGDCGSQGQLRLEASWPSLESATTPTWSTRRLTGPTSRSRWTAACRQQRTKTSAALDAVNPDLTPFRSRGGKLILYHGWNDPAIPAINTINYYEDVVAKVGRANADSFARLYMVPGMQHCGGGPGADTFGTSGSWPANDPQHNIRVALETWVEKGTAPATIIASKTAEGNSQGNPTMTRPLCAYPQAAKYKGSGDTNSADSFVCASATK